MSSDTRRGREGSRAGVGFTQRYGLLLVWLLLIVIFGILSPHEFLTISFMQNIGASQVTLLIVALGLLLPLIAGDWDLSFAGVLTVSMMITGYVDTVLHWSIYVAMLLALVTGLVVGTFNAFVIVRLGVESMIVTLGMGTLLAGIGYWISVNTLSGLSPVITTISGTLVWGLPLEFYFAILLLLVVWFVLDFTPIGKYLYFTGSGRSVAALSGIAVDRLRFGALICCSGLSAVAGILLAGYLGSASADIGAGYLLPAFAAVFLGTTVIKPGRFNALGTLIAVYFLGTGISGLELLGAIGWVTQVFYGGAVIVAVSGSVLVGRSALRRKTGTPEDAAADVPLTEDRPFAGLAPVKE